jgi:hypothetical protein
VAARDANGDAGWVGVIITVDSLMLFMLCYFRDYVALCERIWMRRELPDCLPSDFYSFTPHVNLSFISFYIKYILSPYIAKFGGRFYQIYGLFAK